MSDSETGDGTINKRVALSGKILLSRGRQPGTTGTIEAMSLWAGESVGGVTRVQPAAEIVRELEAETERLLRRRGCPDPSPAG